MSKRSEHHPYISEFSQLRSIVHSYDFKSGGNGPWLELHNGDGLFRKITNMLSTHAIYYKTEKAKQETIDLMRANLNAEKPQHIDWLFADTLQKNLEVRMFESPMFYQHITIPDDYEGVNYDAVTKFRLSQYHYYLDLYFQWEEKEIERWKESGEHLFNKHRN